jgi:mRNA-degrading endonuclease RelE of RelBE toxin-antitoxin system
VKYRIEYADDALEHLRGLPARQRTVVLDAVDRQLVHQPTLVTRNRKPMDRDKRLYVAPWELRLGNLRVYYAVQGRPTLVVLVLAVGIKVRDRIRIGGKEVES